MKRQCCETSSISRWFCLARLQLTAQVTQSSRWEASADWAINCSPVHTANVPSESFQEPSVPSVQWGANPCPRRLSGGIGSDVRDGDVLSIAYRLRLPPTGPHPDPTSRGRPTETWSEQRARGLYQPCVPTVLCSQVRVKEIARPDSSGVPIYVAK
ncbi:hypothetical protein GY45DRAFT_491746 [Cubamyces sp. BRFM 1775]|nr:hypothetical protein GY45DRAFT_491746 [Cubamyces sp. BRFM 1775]